MKKLILAAIISATMVCWAAALCHAQTEEVPQFAGVPVFPSVFFIFDSSDSMNEVPYRTQYGGAYVVSSWRWQDAIRLDSNGNPIKDATGATKYKTVGDAIEELIHVLTGEVSDEKQYLAGETVYENGFNPLEHGIKIEGKPFQIFAQWIECVPTSQVVPVPYEPS